MKKYQIIYADPPWEYRHCATKSRAIENKYPTMKLEDIKNLNVPSDENCVLYMWTTSPKLSEALEVMNAWGFDYRSSMVWDKKIIGMGYWFRGQHELLLVGVKGSISPPPQEKRISSILSTQRKEHSKKPNYIRQKISEWYPELKKLELFARPDDQLDLIQGYTFSGWDVWGNQITSEQDVSDILETK